MAELPDLKIARSTLSKENLSLVIVSGGEVILRSQNHGIAELLGALERFGDTLHGASIADRIVGKAAAYLVLYARMKGIYAPVVSRDARDLLSQAGLECKFGKVVPWILDVEGKDRCPLEKLCASIWSPQEAFNALRTHLAPVKEDLQIDRR